MHERRELAKGAIPHESHAHCLLSLKTWFFPVLIFLSTAKMAAGGIVAEAVVVVVVVVVVGRHLQDQC
jgi:hypothetical protein